MGEKAGKHGKKYKRAMLKHACIDCGIMCITGKASGYLCYECRKKHIKNKILKLVLDE